MCGLTLLAGPVPAEVADVAVMGAARRGPHSHGWAVAYDRWDVTRGAGPLGRPPRLRADMPVADLYIGHSRLATSGASSGTVPDPNEGQPIVVDGTLVAHNGRILDPDLLDRYPATVDTGSFAAALADGEPLDRLASAADGPQAAIIATIDGSIWTARYRGGDNPAHPLYLLAGDGWLAISSGPLPGRALLPEGIHQIR